MSPTETAAAATLRPWTRRGARYLVTALALAGTALMIDSSLLYLELTDMHPFVLEKLPLKWESLFLTALWVHVPSALFALPACFLLLSRTVQKRFPFAHRWLGRLTGLIIIFAAVPSGTVLAFSAKAGLLSTVGFLLTGMITLYAMVQAVRTARAKDYKAHRRYSEHVAAQLSVAVTSRFALIGFDALGFEPDAAYIVALWVPVVLSALVVEWLSPASLLFPTNPRSLSYALNDNHRHSHLRSVARPRLVR